MSETSGGDVSTIDAEAEVGAIKTVLGALGPLSIAARQSVLDYVVKRLGLSGGGESLEVHADPSQKRQPLPPSTTHLKDFKEQKKPRTDSEMAAVIAYWLRDIAPDRRDTVTRNDIEQYFKIGDHPLPKRPEFTLPNAKGAGYFELLGDGKYRLNPVGHNLVVHTLPRADTSSKGARPRRRVERKAKPSKKTTKRS